MSKFAEASIELNDFLEKVKEDGILTKEDIIAEVDNVFEWELEAEKKGGKGKR